MFFVVLICLFVCLLVCLIIYTVEPATSSHSYEQPTSNTKWHFPYKYTSYEQPHALKGHFLCVPRVAAHNRFYCIYYHYDFTIILFYVLKVTYSFEDDCTGCDKFLIHPETGVITANADEYIREEQSVYTLQVQASDNSNAVGKDAPNTSK